MLTQRGNTEGIQVPSVPISFEPGAAGRKNSSLGLTGINPNSRDHKHEPLIVEVQGKTASTQTADWGRGTLVTIFLRVGRWRLRVGGGQSLITFRWGFGGRNRALRKAAFDLGAFVWGWETSPAVAARSVLHTGGITTPWYPVTEVRAGQKLGPAHRQVSGATAFMTQARTARDSLSLEAEHVLTHTLRFQVSLCLPLGFRDFGSCRVVHRAAPSNITCVCALGCACVRTCCVGVWVGECVGAWVRGCVGVWMCGYVGVWVRRCLWVCGCVGGRACGRVVVWAGGASCNIVI